MAAAVHLAIAPPDGFEAWSDDDWDDWLDDHPWEPAETLGPRGDWLVFLYVARVHGKRSQSELAPFFERLMTEKPVRSTELDALRRALRGLQQELATIPAGRLWTGTQFYTHDDLHALILRHEAETGKTGQDLTIADLWRGLFARLDAVLARAEGFGRGVYFGRL